MTKKVIYGALHKDLDKARVRASTPLVLIPLSFLLLLFSACGSTQSSTTPAPGFHTTVQTSDKAFTVQVTITPNQLGNNTFTVKFLAPQQVSSQNMQVSLQTTMLDMAMGTDSLTLQADNQGNYSGQGTLTMSGHWQIQVVIHTPDHALHEGQFEAKLA